MPITRAAHPWLYPLNIERHRFQRAVANAVSRVKFAQQRPELAAELAKFRIVRHKSLLLRKLGDTDMRLQFNKVTNLCLAAKKLDNVVIRPGETFSFWKLVGKPSKRRGFEPGMLLADGNVTEGIGGGLCQFANLLHWMALHTPLTVSERFHHSVDAFPDSGRVLPFGSGATIFYNYVDIRFTNNTPYNVVFKTWVSKEYLHGEFYFDVPPAEAYSVIERDHAYLCNCESGQYHRTNKLYREIRDRKTGEIKGEELLFENYSRMKYAPPVDQVKHDIGCTLSEK